MTADKSIIFIIFTLVFLVHILCYVKFQRRGQQQHTLLSYVVPIVSLVVLVCVTDLCIALLLLKIGA